MKFMEFLACVWNEKSVYWNSSIETRPNDKTQEKEKEQV